MEHPYLMFPGDAPDQLAAKTAAGVAMWRPDRCVGLSFNTSKLSDAEAKRACKAAEDETGLPCVDAWRHGATRLADALG